MRRLSANTHVQRCVRVRTRQLGKCATPYASSCTLSHLVCRSVRLCLHTFSGCACFDSARGACLVVDAHTCQQRLLTLPLLMLPSGAVSPTLHSPGLVAFLVAVLCCSLHCHSSRKSAWCHCFAYISVHSMNSLHRERVVYSPCTDHPCIAALHWLAKKAR